MKGSDYRKIYKDYYECIPTDETGRTFDIHHTESTRKLIKGNTMNIKTGAVTKLRELIAEEGNPALMLRVFVQGGGCSGMSYGFTFEEIKNEDDFDFAYEDVKIVIDSMSMQYLQGADIDYREDVMGSSFVINNPQAQTTCGCGSSFSV